MANSKTIPLSKGMKRAADIILNTYIPGALAHERAQLRQYSGVDAIYVRYRWAFAVEVTLFVTGRIAPNHKDFMIDVSVGFPAINCSATELAARMALLNYIQSLAIGLETILNEDAYHLEKEADESSYSDIVSDGGMDPRDRPKKT